MVFKAVLLCASALLVQSISGQAIGSCGCSLGRSIGGYGGSLGSSIGVNSLALSSGGDFPVISVGPIVPTGIAVVSDVDLAGNLDICGTLPYLSAMQFQAELPTYGSGNVDYSCGSGCNAITSVVGGSQGGVGGSLNNLGGCRCSRF